MTASSDILIICKDIGNPEISNFLRKIRKSYRIIKIMEEQVQIKDQQEFIAYRNQLQFDYQFFRELFFKEKEKWQKRIFIRC